MSKIVSLDGTELNTPKATEPSVYKIVTYSYDDEGDAANEELITPAGYMKFGQMFIAVTDQPDDNGQIVFAIQTPAVKYVEKVTQAA